MRQSTWFITGLTVVLAASAARAQFDHSVGPGGGQIAASGHVHLQRPPTHLRMYLQLTGKGKTLEEALAALKERREAAAARLEKLGVDKSALVFTPPGVDESQAVQQRRMEMMIAQRMGGRGAKKGAKPVKPPAAVTTMLTATWPLTGDTTEKLLLAAESLREKVKAAELVGGKEGPKLSPEEQELAEEMAARNPNQGGDEEQAGPGEPRFLFVALLSPQDRQKALAEAFAKAKTQAAELAKAAGAGLGAMTGLGGEASGGFNPFSRFNFNPYGNRGEIDFAQQAAQSEEQTGEAMAPRPDGIGFDFVVHATFALAATKVEK